jgi:hypothetical protein
MADVEASQVTLKLTTKLPARLRVPPNVLAVPARLTRYGLSEVVNSLLTLGARAAAAPAAQPGALRGGMRRRTACGRKQARAAICAAAAADGS